MLRARGTPESARRSAGRDHTRGAGVPGFECKVSVPGADIDDAAVVEIDHSKNSFPFGFQQFRSFRAFEDKIRKQAKRMVPMDLYQILESFSSCPGQTTTILLDVQE